MDRLLTAQNQERLEHSKHEDYAAPAGFASIEQYAMVHMPISIAKAKKIPAAKAAVDAEWQAHMDKTWDVAKVRPKAEVIAEAQAKNVSVHFSNLKQSLIRRFRSTRA